MKEMLYIPVFFEKGKPLGFHVWTYGKGKHLEYSIPIDPELDHFYSEPSVVTMSSTSSTNGLAPSWMNCSSKAS